MNAIEKEIKVGMVIRDSFRGYLDKEIDEQGKLNKLEITYGETKDFLESIFLIKVNGEEDLINDWFIGIKSMADNFDVEEKRG